MSLFSGSKVEIPGLCLGMIGRLLHHWIIMCSEGQQLQVMKGFVASVLIKWGRGNPLS